ncbi:Wd-repeat protein wdr6, wd repeat superfamily, partial [Globisporangium splendens]
MAASVAQRDDFGAAPYEKHEYIGAVTLVHFSNDGSLLYVGVGSTLYLYDTTSGDLVAQHDILTRGILHGGDFVSLVASSKDALRNVGVFFGQKRVACFRELPQTAHEAAAQQELRRVGKKHTKVFGDWVFDAQILSHETHQSGAFPLLAVGFAHNFIQIWDAEQDHVLRAVQCAERCILYSLAFHGRRLDDLVVASGTVFQQILLWKPITLQTSIESEDAAVVPAQCLHSHDGVLFKLEWSSDASMLASVSDDRTVQLWSNRDLNEFPDKADSATAASGFLQTTESTLAFMSKLQSTAAEDDASSNVVLSKEFRSVFRSWGHSARLWDVKFCAFGLATTSEDAVCKIWDFAGNCVASLQGHMGKHVWRVAVHPSQSIVATGGTDGAVKLWQLRDQVKCTSSITHAFCQSIPLYTDDNKHLYLSEKKSKNTLSIRDIVVNSDRGDVGFVATELGQIFQIDLKANTSTLFYTFGLGSSSGADDGSQQEETGNEKKKQPRAANLSAFSMDASNTMLLGGDATGVASIVDIATATLKCSWKAHETRIMKLWWRSRDMKSDNGSLFTSGADGTLREWRAVGGDAALRMELVVSYKCPGKCAASSLLVVDRSVSRNVVCGDGRGNVFAFIRSLDRECDSEEVIAPSHVLKGAHGREQVTSLLFHDRVLLSGGHDGYICSYLSEFDADGALKLTHIGRDSIKGMATIKDLWWNDNDELLVLGFYASQAILHNFTAQYRLFSIECGGWRRPHALVTKHTPGSASLPMHTFLFTPPAVSKKADIELKVHSAIITGAEYEKEQGPLPTIGNQSSLHHLYHGKMTSAAVMIGNRLVTAAEDNSLKLHIQRASINQKKTRWVCVSSSVAHTTTVRALSAFRLSSASAHILLSGGGKQTINVWRVRDGLDVLELVCSFEKDELLQDHRILGIETFALPGGDNNDRYRLVTACNSEGVIQLLMLDLELARLTELGECSSSKKPILSCASFQRGDDAAILAVGSTDGMVNLWNFAKFLRSFSSPQEFAAGTLLKELMPSVSYMGHDFGANCVTIVGGLDNKSFTVLSGGDDQNVRLHELTLDTLETLNDVRAVNASGSAIKAIYSDGRVVFIAGYDQRVSKWRIVVDAVTGCKTLEWQCAAFSECADIADVAVLEDDEEAHTVVVVGQGLQTIRFRQ